MLASDGVWECFNNKMAMKKINSYYVSGKIEDGCNSIVKKSADHWNNVKKKFF